VRSCSKAGARVDAQTDRQYQLDVRYEVGRTPLLLASEFSRGSGSKHGDVAKQLLEHNASPDLCDANGRTPLHYAAQNG